MCLVVGILLAQSKACLSAPRPWLPTGEEAILPTEA